MDRENEKKTKKLFRLRWNRSFFDVLYENLSFEERHSRVDNVWK